MMKVFGVMIEESDYILDDGMDYFRRIRDGLFFIDESEFNYRDDYTQAYNRIKYHSNYNYNNNKDIIETNQHEVSLPESYIHWIQDLRSYRV
tara:strand:+ start:142 stop:417 length:276 start_codon:yes stop_codon:yes gene_type:complete